MKKQIAARILRRMGLVPRHQTLNLISFKKNILYPHCTWKKFVLNVLACNYLVGELPEKTVYIPELKMYYGGTLVVDKTKNKVYME